jgi:lipopolysaccharide/colanic/teichoic acid biosynthesis glycosyltransferase
MRVGWAVVIGFIGTLLTATLGDLFSEEVRTRLERLPAAVIRFAGRRLPADVRDEWTDEWLAELAYILRGTESLPISRLVRGTRFAVGHLRSAPTIGRELSKADEGLEAMPDALLSQRLDYVAKRILDVLVAGAALLLMLPVMLLIALLVRLTSPGPALSREIRVGYGQSRFNMLRFRTMRQLDAAEYRQFMATPVAELAHDPRDTRIGSFLRRTSLEELPQLVNVLRGEMSLVGPRPLPPRETAWFIRREHVARFAVKPGITGLWQISGGKGITIGQILDREIEYVRHRNLPLDLLILLKTIPAAVMDVSYSKARSASRIRDRVAHASRPSTAPRVGCGVLWHGQARHRHS